MRRKTEVKFKRMPSGHRHIPTETFCIENVLPGEVASEEIDDKRDPDKIAFCALYSRMTVSYSVMHMHVLLAKCFACVHDSSIPFADDISMEVYHKINDNLTIRIQYLYALTANRCDTAGSSAAFCPVIVCYNPYFQIVYFPSLHACASSLRASFLFTLYLQYTCMYRYTSSIKREPLQSSPSLCIFAFKMEIANGC